MDFRHWTCGIPRLSQVTRMGRGHDGSGDQGPEGNVGIEGKENYSSPRQERKGNRIEKKAWVDAILHTLESKPTETAYVECQI